MITKYDNWAENLSLNKGLLYTVYVMKRPKQ